MTINGAAMDGKAAMSKAAHMTGIVTASPVINWIGFRVVDAYGARMGQAVAYVAQQDVPDRDWILVRTGRVTHRAYKLAPFRDAIVSHHEVWLPVEASVVRGSPDVDADASHFDAGVLDEVAAYYHEGRRNAIRHRPSPWFSPQRPEQHQP